MIILAHRGFWRESAEKNTPAAFERAFRGGYGIETDVRDQNGVLVVSHDPPVGKCLAWDTLLNLYVETGSPGRLAINIKADGLAEAVIRSLQDRDLLDRSFVFDMSVPDMRPYLGRGIPVFTRFSDVETAPPFYDRTQGLWVDDFAGDWASSQRAVQDLAGGMSVAMVSPELHGKPHVGAWAAWRDDFRGEVARSGLFGDRLMICTDLPEEARDWFGEL